MTLPAAVPEIPVANVDKAAAYYVNMLGFTFDWGDNQGGIAGISDKPWKLREFLAADLEGNLIRVFYDFRGDRQKNDTSRKVV